MPESILNHRNNRPAGSARAVSSDGISKANSRRSVIASARHRGANNNSRVHSHLDDPVHGRSSSQLRHTRETSPLAKVQFEDLTMDTRDERDRADKSDSTAPLRTDSYSGSEEKDVFENSVEEDLNQQRRKENKTKKREQWGYDPRLLNRIKFRQEHELEEFNFGIDFTKIGKSEEHLQRLREYLMKH